MLGRSRWIALQVLCAGVLMIVLNMTAVNVALAAIQDDLGFSQSGLAWVVNAYLIGLAGVLLLSGCFGDVLGRKRMFLSGLVVFMVASLACGLAQSQAMLVGARFLQGVGGGMSVAVVLGMVVTMFPEPVERANAIGVYTFVATSGGALGLLAGGGLTEWADWHWIFFVNVPMGVATALGAARLVATDDGIGLSGGTDVAGAVLILAALMLGVYTIVEHAATDGWGAPGTVALGGLSLALLAGFVVRQATARAPLVPLGIFRSRNVAGANLVQMLCIAGGFSVFFLGALYMERVLGYSPLEIGLAFLAKPLTAGLMSVLCAGRLIGRFGARAVLIAGLWLVLAGLALFSRPLLGGGYLAHLLPVMLLIGAGMGAAIPSIVTLALSSATDRDAGLVSGLLNTTAQIGAALGLAVFASLSAARSDTLIEAGRDMTSALTSGYRLGFAVAATLILAAILIAATMLERPPRLPASAAEAQPAYSKLEA